MHNLQQLVNAADEAALLRAVDGLCSTRDWDMLVDLAARCREAVEMGKQLWPVATHIDYRLALEAPPSYAGRVLRSGAGRFALGPLTEVAGSRHPWEDLAPHIDDPASAAAVAQERVIRGEDLRGRAAGGIVELPLSLLAFEPDYALPVYRDREAAFPTPLVAQAPLGSASARVAAERLDDDPACAALREVAEAWVAESSGSVDAVAVRGPAEGAVAHLASRAAMAEISPREALALLQWAGASGGAHGRRRGGAAGRFAAWWAAAGVADLDWPDAPDADEQFLDDLADALAELRWFRWAPAGPEAGWLLRLAVTDPLDDLSWAVEATDLLEDDDPLAQA